MNLTIRSLRLATFVVSAALPALGGTPLHPDTERRLREDGGFEQARLWLLDAAARGANQPFSPPLRLPRSVAPAQIRALVVLVDFSDNASTSGSVSTSLADFGTILNSVQTYPTGSVRDFYSENSYGESTFTADVVGWYRMPNPYSYYVAGQTGFGPYPTNAQRLAEDAAAAADPFVDFSDYDNDGDGYVDAYFVVHAGYGFEDTGDSNAIWSHAWGLGSARHTDGVTVSGYTMEPEESGEGGIVHIGVFCHEFGHALGLPDLYDIDGGSNGAGDWTVMSGGVWANGGRTPVHFDPWSKSQLGWVTPIVVRNYVAAASFPAVETSPVVYRLWRNGQSATQYFLVENRRRIGFDAFLPGAGLLIWHIDNGATCNCDPSRFLVGVVQADGDFELEAGAGSDAGDPWPGQGGTRNPNRNFNETSVPSSRGHQGLDTHVGVEHISPPSATMTADLRVMRPLGLRASTTPRLGQPISFVIEGPEYRRYRLLADTTPGTTCQGGVCYGLAFTPRLRILADSITGSSPPLDGSGVAVVTGNVPNQSRLVGRVYFLQAVVDTNADAPEELAVSPVIAETIEE